MFTSSRIEIVDTRIRTGPVWLETIETKTTIPLSRSSRIVRACLRASQVSILRERGRGHGGEARWGTTNPCVCRD